MGNSPGDLEDYFELLQEYDSFCGAFVWEWCDHAVFTGQTADGKPMFQYDGDFGEKDYSSNFCLDGLVYPDRRPRTGLLELKNVNRPLRVSSYDPENGILTLRNYRDFTNCKEDITLAWEVNRDGDIIASGYIEAAEMPSIKPHEEGSLCLKVPVPEAGRCFLKLYYYLNKATELLPQRHLLGFDEILLENKDKRNQKTMLLMEQAAAGAFNSMQIQESEKYLTIRGLNFCYKYNKFTGMFEQMHTGDRELITRPMQLNLWRAMTDNDKGTNGAGGEWIKARYSEPYVRTYDTEFSNNGKEVQISGILSVGVFYTQPILNIKTVWTITGQGAVHMDMSVKKDPEFPMLPRFGLRIFLPKEMDHVTYYGMRPQENGSHYDCDYVIVQVKAQGVAVASEKCFCFNASVYTQEELAQKSHNYELIPLKTRKTGHSFVFRVYYIQSNWSIISIISTGVTIKSLIG